MSKDEIIKIHKQAIQDYKMHDIKEILVENGVNTLAIKGYLINQGYCSNYAYFLVDRLVKVIDHNRIKIYEWSPLHTVVTVDDVIILDAEHENGIEFNRNNLNNLFLCFASRIALTLQEYYYIVASNRIAIIYDPWDFVDNQKFDHELKPTIPSIEKIYTTEQYLNSYNGQLTLGRLIYYLNTNDKSKPVYFDDGTRPCGIVLYAKTNNELAIEFNGEDNKDAEVIPTAGALFHCLTEARDKEFTSEDDVPFKVDYDTPMVKANFGSKDGKIIVGVSNLTDRIELVTKQ